MALKSKEWFYKQCLRHMEDRTRLGFLLGHSIKRNWPEGQHQRACNAGDRSNSEVFDGTS